MANKNLTQAKRAKNDEFYTQYPDIEREMNAYIEYDPDVFRDKVVLLPCDDPVWSNFTKYFAQNFDRFGLRKLISTSYAPAAKGDLFINHEPSELERNSPQFDPEKSPTHGKVFIIDRDVNGDGKKNLQDIEWRYMEGDGDFRSHEVTELRNESNFIITNPPFSIFREFMAWIMASGKQFAVIANKNCITYKEIFPLIQRNEMWVGSTSFSKDILFLPPFAIDPRDYPASATKAVDGKIFLRSPSVWFANIDHGRRHQPLPLMTMADNLKFSRHMKDKSAYDRYDNYDAIDVPATAAIPSDYDGVMGVPITFLDKYCPEQFSILGMTSTSKYDATIMGIPILNEGSAMPLINKLKKYARVFIRKVK